MDLRPHIEKFRRRFAEVEAALSDPEGFRQPAARAGIVPRIRPAQGTGRRAATAYLKTLADLAENRALLKTEPAESELAQLAREEIARLEAEEKKLAQQIQFGLVPPDPTDSRNTIIEIRAGAGGSESALFAADLYRMYCRYAEARGWKVETLDSSPSDLGGFKEIIFQRHRHGCFQAAEIRERRASRPARARHRGAGPHPHQHRDRRRAARGRRKWTSKSSRTKLEINVCRASGKGGQGVNTTDSAVQIIHKPTRHDRALRRRAVAAKEQGPGDDRSALAPARSAKSPRKTRNTPRTARSRSAPANATKKSAPTIFRKTASPTIASKLTLYNLPVVH